MGVAWRLEGREREREGRGAGFHYGKIICFSGLNDRNDITRERGVTTTELQPLLPSFPLLIHSATGFASMPPAAGDCGGGRCCTSSRFARISRRSTLVHTNSGGVRTREGGREGRVRGGDSDRRPRGYAAAAAAAAGRSVGLLASFGSGQTLLLRTGQGMEEQGPDFGSENGIEI